MKELLREALPYLERTADVGPEGYGWKSNELEALIQRIREALQESAQSAPAPAGGRPWIG